MGKFCGQCGKEITEENGVCPVCGAPAPDVSEPVEAAPAVEAAPVVTQTPKADSKKAQKEPIPRGGKFGVLRTIAFMGLMLLFAIPVVGLIAGIIMTFAPKNRNIRSFARANVIYQAIAIVLVICLVIGVLSLLGMAAGTAVASIGSLLSEPAIMEDMGEILDLFSLYQSGNYDAIMEKLENGELDGLIERAENGEFNAFFDAMDEDFSGAIANPGAAALPEMGFEYSTTDVEDVPVESYD